MKTIKIVLTFVCLFAFSAAYSQSQHRYVANPSLDKFVGTWAAQGGEDFKIILIKEIRHSVRYNISGDGLYGYYIYNKGDIKLNSKNSAKRTIDFGGNGGNSSKNKNKLGFTFLDISNDKWGNGTLELLPGKEDEALLNIYPRETVIVGKRTSPPTSFLVPVKIVMKKEY
ncbi:MAG: DUF6705 family protein [Daejeonella sp.]